jgi:hypothetical protein
MRESIFNAVGNLDTLLAVILGAVLATGGSLLAEMLQDRRVRKHRARDTARFFGEILTSIDQLIDLAIQSQAVGNPWGPVTLRLFESALSEAAVYERNRERLFDLPDMELRMRIHGHVLSETISIEALIDQCRLLSALEVMRSGEGEPDPATASEKADLERARQLTMASLQTVRESTDALLDALSVIAMVPIKSKLRASMSPDGVARWHRKE